MCIYLFFLFVFHTLIKRSTNLQLYRVIMSCVCVFQMSNVTKEHCLEIIAKFEPCPENQKQGVLGIDGKMRSVFSLENILITLINRKLVKDVSEIFNKSKLNLDF